MTATISTVLPNFPQVNQLTQAENGQLDPNRDWDCVVASLAAGLKYCTGKTYYEHDLRSIVYGSAYRGGMAAASFVQYCAEQGVTLTPYDGTPERLVAKIHAELEAGHPVIATVPSMWGIPVSQQRPGFTTHVIIFCAYGEDALGAMNPWTAPVPLSGVDGYWLEELVDNQIWILSKGASMGIPTGWHDSANGSVSANGLLTAPNGVTVDGGFRDTILQSAWLPANIPLAKAVRVPQCDPTTGTGGEGEYQLFAYLTLVWQEATNKIWSVTDGAYVEVLQKQVASLEAQLAAKPTPAPTEPAPTPAPAAPSPYTAIGEAFVAAVKQAEAAK